MNATKISCLSSLSRISSLSRFVRSVNAMNSTNSTNAMNEFTLQPIYAQRWKVNKQDLTPFPYVIFPRRHYWTVW